MMIGIKTQTTTLQIRIVLDLKMWSTTLSEIELIDDIRDSRSILSLETQVGIIRLQIIE